MKIDGPIRGLIYGIPISLLLWALLILGALAVAPDAGAKPLCEARGTAHIEKHGGLAKDSADHIARGELPTCDPNPEARERKGDNSPDDQKSRYCRKKWYC